MVAFAALSALAAACSDGPGRAGDTEAAPAAAGAAGGRADAQAACDDGIQLLLRGEVGRAETAFEHAIALDPEHAAGHFYLGQLRVQRSGQVVDSTEMSFARRNVETLAKGIESIERAVALDPTNAEYVAWLGRAYHQADDLPNARRCLEKAVELVPGDAIARKRLGMVYMAAGENELARATFAEAIERDPNDANSHFHLGQMLELARDVKGARAAYERAIACNPTQPEYYRTLLTVLERLGDKEAADQAQRDLVRWQEYDAKVERREKRVEANPRDPATVRRLGEVYLEGERWSLAAEWCKKALVLDPRDVQALLCCGVALRELGEHAGAEQHLREAEYLAPDLLDAKLELVRLYAATGDAQRLAAIVATVERNGAKQGAALWDLGEVCREVGREDDAARLFAAAKALGVEGPSAPSAETAATPGGG